MGSGRAAWTDVIKQGAKCQLQDLGGGQKYKY